MVYLNDSKFLKNYDKYINFLLRKFSGLYLEYGLQIQVSKILKPDANY